MDVRDELISAAARVYAEAGFRGATTRRIAQEAGVNEITLFRHFGTKEALVKAALQAAHHQPTPVMLSEPVDPEQELYAWALATYRHWYERRALVCRVMGDSLEHPELAPRICEEPSCEHAMVSRYLARLRERGLATGEFIPDAAAGLLLGALFTHAIWRDHFASPDLPPAEEVVRKYVELVLDAVGARSTSARNGAARP